MRSTRRARGAGPGQLPGPRARLGRRFADLGQSHLLADEGGQVRRDGAEHLSEGPCSRKE